MQIESNRKSLVRTVERLACRKEHDRAGDDEPARNYDVSRASQVPFYYVYRPRAVRCPSPGGAPTPIQSVCIRTGGCGALR
jgi:hypothetical protein